MDKRYRQIGVCFLLKQNEMLKKLLISSVIVFAQLFGAYSMNKQDSIYLDMSRFLIQKGNKPKEMESYDRSFIPVFEIVSKADTPNFVDIPFGIFRFNYNGCMGCVFYVLIKYNNQYKVINQFNTALIIRLLFDIRDNNPELISNEQFKAYIRAIANLEIIGHERDVLVTPIGSLEYFTFF